ncbi:MAG: PA domain-containing protein [Flavobacteriia bacterium]|jgi:hypothetical protein
MKKILFTLVIGLSCSFAKSQAVFNVTNPSSISGNYDFTWADPAGGWSSPDFNVQGTFIEDTLMVADDGSPGLNAQGNPVSAEACNPLINNLTGKIAVIYRNNCEFGTKALNAQNAGAIGVIIINRDSDVIEMGPGADGVNVTIPVAFVSNITGELIVDEMLNGPVTVFMGNKVGYFQYDLGMNQADIFIPNPNTNTSIIAQNDTEYSVRVGAFVNNFGYADQVNGSLNAVITYNGNEVYNESSSFDLLSSDNTGIELPIFSQTTYPVGKYTITYTITSPNADEYTSDNTYSTDFFISNEIFSYVGLNADNEPQATSGYRPSGTAGTVFTSCIHFRDPNASRAKAKGLYFSGYNTDQVFDGRLVEIYAYKWNNQFVDINDSINSVFDDYEQVGFANYNYSQDSMNLVTVFAPFDNDVTLIDDQRYLFCVTTYETDMYLGYGNLDYSTVYANELQPLFPITWDQFYLGGFGADTPPSIGVKLQDVNSLSITEQDINTILVYPNPATNKINISGDDLIKYTTIELRDQLGRSISSWNINSNVNSIDVSKFAAGNYLLVLTGTNGTEVKQVQINK